MKVFTFASIIAVLSMVAGTAPMSAQDRHGAASKAPAEIAPDALKEKLDRGEKLLVIDVREPDEVAAGSIPQAINVPMSVLGQRMSDIPKDVHLVFACASGQRSARAAELFRKNGYETTSYCALSAWNARRLPLEPVKKPGSGPIAPAQK
jgi:rhodanese-related sulfurtransferase